jgi:hypothetical protein
LAVWITAVAASAWLMLWLLSGEPWGSFLAIVAPMALFAARTPPTEEPVRREPRRSKRLEER